MGAFRFDLLSEISRQPLDSIETWPYDQPGCKTRMWSSIWHTDSPAKVQIQPQALSGARLTAIGHSAQGSTYDINIWVTVDGVSSANFPVFINTPWTQSRTGPSPTTTCAALFGLGVPNGWVGRVTNRVQDLTGSHDIIPIDATETFENEKLIYQGTDWGGLGEAKWPANTWQGNTFIDTYAMCWGGGALRQFRRLFPGMEAGVRQSLVTPRSTGWVRSIGFKANAHSEWPTRGIPIVSP